MSAVYLELRIKAENAAFCVSADLPDKILHPTVASIGSYQALLQI